MVQEIRARLQVIEALVEVGEVRVPITRRGKWYVKFIRMDAVKDSVDYESKWASLTFEIR